MNSTSFMYGSELQGSGHISTESTVVGITMFVLALTGLLFGSINLYFIKNVKIFHNAFGWFWSGRTVSEMVVNSGYALYQGPVTILQPRALPPELGMLAYFVLCFGAVTSCSIHAAIAVNRNQAVYSPLRYGRIFTKKNSYAFIVFAWLNAALIIPTFCGGYR
ncbi:hypothetical protein QR680_015646 [Steinernema hermaphroditum]|uniref:7TM GPCR serpentine receptor class x (Srx) domain-containing protein n=1 Tax=Steinernema hermaphroditum TaxID=289476 RepID=A0AA39H8I8_9BILA|nr:hypothetical protein QR680_015646 [Steinernema hermaphroditum]